MKKFLVVTLIILVLAMALIPATFPKHIYVSSRGSDSNPGSKSMPVQSIQRAVQLVKGHTVVNLAPSVYRESVTFTHDPSPLNSIELRGDSSDRNAVTIRGSEPSNGLEWKPCDRTTCPEVGATLQKSVYVTSLPWNEIPTILTETLPDGTEQVLTLARSPNERIEQAHKYHEFWWQATGQGPTINTLRDPVHLMGGTDISGGRAYIIDGADRCGTFLYVRSVSGHDRTTGTLMTDQPIGAVTYGRQETGISKYSKYFVENALGLLDHSGEWFYDRNEKKLYVWPLENRNPRDLSVEIGRRDTGIRIDRSNVTIRDISVKTVNDIGYFDKPTGGIVIAPTTDAYSIRIRNVLLSHMGAGVTGAADDTARIRNVFVTDSRFEKLAKSAVSITGPETKPGTISKIRLHNLFITDTGFPFNETALFVARANDIVIDGNEINNTASGGIQVSGYEKKGWETKNVSITSNSINHACQNSSGCSSMKLFGGPFFQTIVSDNTLTNNRGWSSCQEQNGFTDKGIGLFISNASGINVRNNISTGNSGAAFIAFTRQLATTDNTFVGNTASYSLVGIALSGAQEEPDVNPSANDTRHDRTVITGNTFDHTDTALVLDPAKPNSLTVRENSYIDNVLALEINGVVVATPSAIPEYIPAWGNPETN